MKSPSKRTSTQPGLGKVTSQTLTRFERAKTEQLEATDPRAISAPPPSGADGPPSRRTREMASGRPPGAEVESRAPRSTPIPRGDSDGDERPSEGSRSGRPAIDVTRVDPRRLDGTRTSSSPRPGSFDSGETSTGTRRTAVPSSRPGASSRPAPVSRPAPAPTALKGPGDTARSRRVSIREDDLGAAIKRGPDATWNHAARTVPRIVRTKAELAAAPIDHRAGFLLAHIDGVTSVQGLVDVAGMAENEVHEILDRLTRLGIVALR